MSTKLGPLATDRKNRRLGEFYGRLSPKLEPGEGFYSFMSTFMSTKKSVAPQLWYGMNGKLERGRRTRFMVACLQNVVHRRYGSCSRRRLSMKLFFVINVPGHE